VRATYIKSRHEDYDMREAYFSVATLYSLREMGSNVTMIAEQILSELILPFKLPYRIMTEDLEDNRRYYKFNDKNWTKVKHMIEFGELYGLSIEGSLEEYKDIGAIPFQVSLGISFDVEKRRLVMYDMKRTMTDEISFNISPVLFSDRKIPQTIQDKLVDAFTYVFERVGGIIGMLSLDEFGCGGAYDPGRTGLEFMQDLDHSDHSKNFTDTLRGYFWGNILTESHIKKLGGLDHIKSNAPCHKVRELNINDRQAVYLQLTPDINDYSDDVLRQLKNFFLPALPIDNVAEVRDQKWARIVDFIPMLHPGCSREQVEKIRGEDYETLSKKYRLIFD
jgi:hypothetical protein